MKRKGLLLGFRMKTIRGQNSRSEVGHTVLQAVPVPCSANASCLLSGTCWADGLLLVHVKTIRHRCRTNLMIDYYIIVLRQQSLLLINKPHVEYHRSLQLDKSDLGWDQLCWNDTHPQTGFQMVWKDSRKSAWSKVRAVTWPLAPPSGQTQGGAVVEDCWCRFTDDVTTLIQLFFRWRCESGGGGGRCCCPGGCSSGRWLSPYSIMLLQVRWNTGNYWQGAANHLRCT